MTKKISFEIDREDVCLPFTIDAFVEIFFVTAANLHTHGFLLQKAVLLGIDTETRPSFYSSSRLSSPTALLQVAVRTSEGSEVVLIFDLLDISESPDKMLQLGDILGPLLTDGKVLKVGQGLSNDFLELSSSYPTVDAFSRVTSIVETNRLLRHLQPDIKNDVSLKHITKSYLHCNLVKTQQCSNWGVRPLSQSQIDYAARDALVLIRLYDVMTSEAEDLGTFDIDSLLINFDRDAYMSNSQKRHSGIPLSIGSDGTTLSSCSSVDHPVRTNSIAILQKEPQHTRFDDDSTDCSSSTGNADTSAGGSYIKELYARTFEPNRFDYTSVDDHDDLESLTTVCSVSTISGGTGALCEEDADEFPLGRCVRRRVLWSSSKATWSPLHASVSYNYRKHKRRRVVVIEKKTDTMSSADNGLSGADKVPVA